MIASCMLLDSRLQSTAPVCVIVTPGHDDVRAAWHVTTSGDVSIVNAILPQLTSASGIYGD